MGNGVDVVGIIDVVDSCLVNDCDGSVGVGVTGVGVLDGTATEIDGDCRIDDCEGSVDGDGSKVDVEVGVGVGDFIKIPADVGDVFGTIGEVEVVVVVVIFDLELLVGDLV